MSRRTRTPEERRQVAEAMRMGEDFYGGRRFLVPSGCHGSLVAQVEAPLTSWWGDMRLIDCAWAIVVLRLERHDPFSRLVDHAWSMCHRERRTETWGVVLEPYVSTQAAREVVLAFEEEFASWGLTIHALPAARSSWNPGGCVPIVVVMGDGMVGTFMVEAVRWALNDGAESYASSPLPS